MITDRERIGIVEFLRDEADYWRKYNKDDDTLCMSDSDFTESILGAFGFDGTVVPVCEVFEKLADLVDRPTCRMVEVKTGEVADYRDVDEIIFHCESCHTERGIFSYDEDGNVYSARPEYCPNCGAKVINDD